MTLTLDQLQADLDRGPLSRFLGVTAERVDPGAGEASFGLRMRPEASRLDGSDQVHGGALATFIDIAGDYAVAAIVGGAVPTMNLLVNYLRPAAGPRLVAHARVRKLGRTVVVVDVDVEDGDRRLVAIGRGSYGANPG